MTGASAGIGAALAVALACEGATVGICARREDRLAEVYERVHAFAPESRMWVFDVGDLGAIPAFVAQVEGELGGIDLLVNNAGIPKRRRGSAKPTSKRSCASTSSRRLRSCVPRCRACSSATAAGS